MSQNLFLRPTEFYQRNINPIAQYVDQQSFYLSRMTSQPKEICKAFVASKVRTSIKNPTIHYFERDDEGDRYQHEGKLAGYISSVVKNDEILTPTGTTYVPTYVKKSILVGFIDNNVRVRSIAKKESFVAKAEGNTDLYIMKNNEQDNRKRYNNSMSGAFLAGGCVINNPTAHSSLTSITRTVSSLGNASNEKIIGGNRHYRDAKTALNNLISVTSTLNRDAFAAVMTKYKLHYPSVDETMACIMHSTDLYFNDPMAMGSVSRFVNKLEPIERAGFVYIGDLYHIRKYNDTFVRGLLYDLATPSKIKDYDDAIAVINKADELIVNFAHQAYMNEVRGIGKDYKKLSKASANKIANVVQNAEDTIVKYKDFIDEVLLTRNVPASTAFIPNMIRRTVVLSDTDSTMFSIDEWVTWYFGSLTFSDEAFAIAGAVMFIATQSIAHLLAIFSANMNVDRAKLFALAMKPEFCFAVFCQSSVAKHYWSWKLVREGNVFAVPEMEIKGVHLKNSAAPQSLIKDSHRVMEEIVNDIFSGRGISIVEHIQRVMGVERKITESLLAGDVEFFKTAKIKSPEAYAKSAEESPYQHHILWSEVFEHKYGKVELPPYGVIKVPTTLTNRTKLRNWLDSMDDRVVAQKMAEWIMRKGKTNLPTMYLSTQYVKSYGVPKEIKAIMDIKRIVLDLTTTDRMILETLGEFPKVGWTLTELNLIATPRSGTYH